MEPYTIRKFWRRRLRRDAEVRVGREVPVAGWSFLQEQDKLPTFCEARLKLSTDLGGGVSPEACSILLVSAPGAVGKTTLAREIASATGSIYIDLSKAATVGPGMLINGIYDSGLSDAWRDELLTVLIDGLDEARLRVTEESFRDFLSDVAKRSAKRTIPTVLFGRTGAIEEAWLVLDEEHSEVDTAVLEIDYYDEHESVDFANTLMRNQDVPLGYSEVRSRAVELLLEKLRSATEKDGDRFAGYAPVLQAVAKHVAEESNPGDLVSRLRRGDQPMTLQRVLDEIMERERNKLKELSARFQEPSIATELYSPDEQLDHLIARIYGGPVPPMPESMLPSDMEKYDHALETWVEDHPFYTKPGATPPSLVFSAAIAARALHSPLQAVRSAVLRKQIDERGGAPNPFVSEFYLADAEDMEPADAKYMDPADLEYIEPEHIGIIYASVRAGLALDDTATLSVEPLDGSPDESELFADVEIAVTRHSTGQPRVFRLTTDREGLIVLGSEIEDVLLVAPDARVKVGTDQEVVFKAPVNIECKKLIVSARNVIVELSHGWQEAEEEASVLLEADSCDDHSMSSVPVVRGNVSLSVWWPGAINYPWRDFANEPLATSDDLRVKEGLERFRRVVTVFRGGKKSGLQKSTQTFQNLRMTKGSGRAVLDLMLSRGILKHERPMYMLDKNRLSELTGMSYKQFMEKKFSEKAIAFVEEALEAKE